MFFGTYTPKLDDKGRLTLPAKFRDALAGGLMVTKSQDHSLAVYPRAEFEAMIADSNQNWAKADSFYETAVGLTTTPAGALNNWGYSKLTRGDYADAERLFADAIRLDGKLFTAKNNLILARGAQREYSLPPIEMDQRERAQLLHTLALSAIKKGDVETGKGLLRDAISTHPQHFEAAVRSLRAAEWSAREEDGCRPIPGGACSPCHDSA